MNYTVGVASIETRSRAGRFDAFFHAEYGLVPFCTYYTYGDMVCVYRKTGEEDAIKAIAKFIEHTEVEGINYLYTAYSDGWGLFERDEKEPEGWKLIDFYDKIAVDEQRRGA